jgi:hypothetical protein
MADSLISGPQAVADAVAALLKARWATELATIAADMGVTLTVPNSTHGYSSGRLLPRNVSPSCEVYIDSSAWDDTRLVQVGAPRRTITTLRVRIRWAPKVAVDAEREAQAYVMSARRAIMRHWRAYHSATSDKMRAVDVEVDTDEAASSVRARGQAEGLTDYGRGYEATDETVELIVRVDHFVNNPITFS